MQLKMTLWCAYRTEQLHLEITNIIVFNHQSKVSIFLSPDLESSQKQVEVDKKSIDELIRERDILNKVSGLVHVLSSECQLQPL